MKLRNWVVSLIGLGMLVTACPVFANCSSLPNLSTLQGALESAVGSGNGGLGFNMWATLVSNDGVVCAVAFSGADFTGQWLGSRVISAQKAEHGERFQSELHRYADEKCFPPRLGIVHGQPVLGCAAGRQPLWFAA
jgi:hypothetical protein